MKYSGVKELDMGAPYSTDSGKKMLIRKGGLGRREGWGERGEERQRMIKQLTNGTNIYKW